jgi:hypothetical protein
MMVVLPVVDCNLLPAVDVCSIDQYKGTKSVMVRDLVKGNPKQQYGNGARSLLQCEGELRC